jgi:hypothetical protein
MEPKNRFQGTNSVRLCSLAVRYNNPIPTRLLALIDCLKIPAQKSGRKLHSETMGGAIDGTTARTWATAGYEGPGYGLFNLSDYYQLMQTSSRRVAELGNFDPDYDILMGFEVTQTTIRLRAI